MDQKSTVGEQPATDSTAATIRTGGNATKVDSDEEVGVYPSPLGRFFIFIASSWGGSCVHTAQLGG